MDPGPDLQFGAINLGFLKGAWILGSKREFLEAQAPWILTDGSCGSARTVQTHPGSYNHPHSAEPCRAADGHGRPRVGLSATGMLRMPWACLKKGRAEL